MNCVRSNNQSLKYQGLHQVENILVLEFVVQTQFLCRAIFLFRLSTTFLRSVQAFLKFIEYKLTSSINSPAKYRQVNQYNTSKLCLSSKSPELETKVLIQQQYNIRHVSGNITSVEYKIRSLVYIYIFIKLSSPCYFLEDKDTFPLIRVILENFLFNKTCLHVTCLGYKKV